MPLQENMYWIWTTLRSNAELHLEEGIEICSNLNPIPQDTEPREPNNIRIEGGTLCDSRFYTVWDLDAIMCRSQRTEYGFLILIAVPMSSLQVVILNPAAIVSLSKEIPMNSATINRVIHPRRKLPSEMHQQLYPAWLRGRQSHPEPFRNSPVAEQNILSPRTGSGVKLP